MCTMVVRKHILTMSCDLTVMPPPPPPPPPPGLTLPLLTTSSGEKLGKSASNALWLSPGRTSCYEFYQQLVRTSDQDVGQFLQYFTFLSLEEVESVMREQEVKRPQVNYCMITTYNMSRV